jgi:hypothetical protein
LKNKDLRKFAIKKWLLKALQFARIAPVIQGTGRGLKEIAVNADIARHPRNRKSKILPLIDSDDADLKEAKS